jgi:hypothetical protein
LIFGGVADGLHKRGQRILVTPIGEGLLGRLARKVGHALASLAVLRVDRQHLLVDSGGFFRPAAGERLVSQRQAGLAHPGPGGDVFIVDGHRLLELGHRLGVAPLAQMDLGDAHMGGGCGGRSRHLIRLSGPSPPGPVSRYFEPDLR